MQAGHGGREPGCAHCEQALCQLDPNRLPALAVGIRLCEERRSSGDGFEALLRLDSCKHLPRSVLCARGYVGWATVGPCTLPPPRRPLVVAARRSIVSRSLHAPLWPVPPGSGLAPTATPLLAASPARVLHRMLQPRVRTMQSVAGLARVVWQVGLHRRLPPPRAVAALHYAALIASVYKGVSALESAREKPEVIALYRGKSRKRDQCFYCVCARDSPHWR